MRFDAHVVNRSKNTGYVECDVIDPDGKLIAKATSTCTDLGRPSDRGEVLDCGWDEGYLAMLLASAARM